MASGKAGKDSRKAKTKAVSHLHRTGLWFPVGHIHQHPKSRTISPRCVGDTAMLENLTTQIFELAGSPWEDVKEKHITPCNLLLEVVKNLTLSPRL
jgi:histone H2A